jgi:hypothetical protein
MIGSDGDVKRFVNEIINDTATVWRPIHDVIRKDIADRVSRIGSLPNHDVLELLAVIETAQRVEALGRACDLGHPQGPTESAPG